MTVLVKWFIHNEKEPLRLDCHFDRNGTQWSAVEKSLTMPEGQ